MSHEAVITEMRELDRRRRAAGIAVMDICRGAGISRATYYRWLDGISQPKVPSFLAVERTLYEIEQELFRIANERMQAEHERKAAGVVAAKDARREREAQWEALPPIERRRAMREWQQAKKIQARYAAQAGRMAAAKKRRERALERRRSLGKAT